MMTRKVKTLAPILLLLLLASACIHKTGGAITPWERVHTYNASLAEANNAIEQGAEWAVTDNLLTVAQATPIINWTGQVAIVHQQATAILAQGNASAANVASVKAMVDTIKKGISALPPAALGIKNPKTQQAFQSDAANIGALADALLAALESVGGAQ